MSSVHACIAWIMDGSCYYLQTVVLQTAVLYSCRLDHPVRPCPCPSVRRTTVHLQLIELWPSSAPWRHGAQCAVPCAATVRAASRVCSSESVQRGAWTNAPIDMSSSRPLRWCRVVSCAPPMHTPWQSDELQARSRRRVRPVSLDLSAESAAIQQCFSLTTN